MKNPYSNIRRFVTGFSLIELMVTLAIAAILLMIAAPDMSSLVERNRVETYRTDLISDISFARQEAITRNQPITLCSSDDGASCLLAADWTAGWIVFVDQDGVAGVVDGADEVLKIHAAINAGDKLQSTEDYFQFNSRGWLVVPGANTDVTLTIDSVSGGHIRGVLVMVSGRALASRADVNGDHYVKVDNLGDPVILNGY